MPASIQTERLRLVSMSPRMLRMLLHGDLESAATLGEFHITAPCSLTGQSWVEDRCNMIEEDRAQHPWMNRAIVRKHDNRMIGHIGFHHKAPDPLLTTYSAHAVELGYSVDAAYRRQGYAWESAFALMAWAHREFAVEDFVVSIRPDNDPSLRLASAMGFQRVGEHIDEVDGLEWVMKARFSALHERPAMATETEPD